MMESKDTGNKFMNWFWDLASDSHERRTLAAKLIIKHIIEAQKLTSDISTDADYAMKRLVRGISSSRESARLGFSTCLCQLLSLFPAIDSNEVCKLLDESTQVYAVSCSLYGLHFCVDYGLDARCRRERSDVWTVVWLSDNDSVWTMQGHYHCQTHIHAPPRALSSQDMDP